MLIIHLVIVELGSPCKRPILWVILLCGSCGIWDQKFTSWQLVSHGKTCIHSFNFVYFQD